MIDVFLLDRIRVNRICRRNGEAVESVIIIRCCRPSRVDAQVRCALFAFLDLPLPELRCGHPYLIWILELLRELWRPRVRRVEDAAVPIDLTHFESCSDLFKMLLRTADRAIFKARERIFILFDSPLAFDALPHPVHDVLEGSAWRRSPSPQLPV